MTDDALALLAGLRLEDGQPWGRVATEFQLADARAVLAPGPGDARLHWLGRPKGGSKTTDLGGVAIAWLLTASQALDEAYVIAADQDQARRLLGRAAGLITRTPGLGDRLDVQSWSVVNRANGAKVIALAADAAGAEGLISPLILVDELPQWPDTASARAMWDAAFSSIPKCMALPGGVTFAVIGHAGIEGSWQHRTFERLSASPSWRFNDVPGPLPWLDEALLEDQRAALTDAQYARRVLNEWSTGDDAIATIDELRRCVTHAGPLPPQHGVRYVVAADLGVKNDRTVATVAHLEPIPGSGARSVANDPGSMELMRHAAYALDRGAISSVEYQERVSLLTEGVAGVRLVVDRMQVWQGSRRSPVSLTEVKAWLLAASRSFNGASLVVDPWQALMLIEELRAAGVTVEEFTFSAQSVGRLASTLHRLIRDQALGLPDDEDLLDELTHVRLVERSPGSVRMDHDSGRHDDRAITLALAGVHLLDAPAPQETSVVRYRNGALGGTR